MMFSDGIRPGGDLTELDGSAEVTRMPPRRSRVQKKVERHSQGNALSEYCQPVTNMILLSP